MQKSLRDFLAGAIFVAFGLAFAIAAYSYDLGTAVRMGPGYFPLLLGALLTLLGIGVIAEGAMTGEGAGLGPIPWRAIALIVAAIFFFGLTVRGLGLVPTLLIVTLAASLASRRTTPTVAVLIAVGLTALCVGIFAYALGLNLPLLGPWLQF
jgi:hypothetical protein